MNKDQACKQAVQWLLEWGYDQVPHEYYAPIKATVEDLLSTEQINMGMKISFLAEKVLKYMSNDDAGIYFTTIKLLDREQYLSCYYTLIEQVFEEIDDDKENLVEQREADIKSFTAEELAGELLKEGE